MEWYYEIKGRSAEGGFTKWAFPPIFCGKVSGRDKDEARDNVYNEYNLVKRRDLLNDLADMEILLRITLMDEDKAKFFIYQECKHCGGPFKIINHYNNANQQYKGSEFCSDECRNNAANLVKHSRDYEERQGSNSPVIYCIRNIKTNMCYIGKTTQPFTLRWYQHFFLQKNTKLGKAIQESMINEWIFQVLEVIEIPNCIVTKEEKERYIAWKECSYIKIFDTVKKGYNTTILKDYKVEFEFEN